MQKHNLLLKNYVITLRKGGKTYDQINKITGRNIPKSTLSYWSHGISFSPKQKLRHLKNRQENIKRAQRLAWAANKRRREMYLSKIRQENEHLLAAVRNADVAKIVLIILYICEGSKNRRGALTFGNSSPEVIQMFLKLLRQCYIIDEKKFRCLNFIQQELIRAQKENVRKNKIIRVFAALITFRDTYLQNSCKSVTCCCRAHSSIGRALPWHGRGSGFDPR